MRNILVFPDGSQQHFQYPVNRDLDIGEKLQVLTKDESIQVMEIANIEKREKDILYYLKRL